jgi:putative DNA methylase
MTRKADAMRKKLIEVALPLKAINQASAREKSIRHGHPSTLHLWWARRPLAACRAVLFASLVDDPDSDPQYRLPDGTVLDSAGRKRADLFGLIEELVQWENSGLDHRSGQWVTVVQLWAEFVERGAGRTGPGLPR